MLTDPSLLPAGYEIQLPTGVSVVLPSLDFETYSEAGYYLCPRTGKIKGHGPQGKGGLTVVGTPVYAEHPSTRILCLYYDLKDGKGRRRWLPGTPSPWDLIAYIQSGGLIEAWNVTFEFWIWNMVATRRLGWVALPLEQCRCAMAKSRRSSLPGGLDPAAKVMGTPRKDKDGTRLLQKLTRPHTPTKNRPEICWTEATAWDEYLRLYDYCDGDVHAEDCVSARIPDLTAYELPVWQMDQVINVRGVQVDTVTLDAALNILQQAEQKYTQELKDLTGDEVGSVNELANMRQWLADSGLNLPDMKAPTVTEALKNDRMSVACRRVLSIRDSLGAANVKKLRTLKLQVSSDGRLRNQYAYSLAHTGRWSAGGVQLQNITAKGPAIARCECCEKIFGRGDHLPVSDSGDPVCPRCGSWLWHELSDWTIEGVEQAIEDIRTINLDVVERMWGDAIAVLCGILRGLFTAKDGHKLVCCDFSAIEAVAAACLSRCQWRIEVFATHGKIYEQSASNATGIPFQEILDYKEKNGMSHPARKGVGKIRELAGGYGGWVGAWKNFGADKYFPDDDSIKADVLKWREESPEIVDMWGGQYKWCGPGKWDYRPELFGLEGAFIQAVLNPGQIFGHIDISYQLVDDVVLCTLPSGRRLKYHRPRLIDTTHKLTRKPAYKITFEGYNSNSAKGPVGWTVMETYGGRLFENVVQAVAYDIQAEALLRCEANGYPIVMHTHDEGTAEVPEGVGSVEHMASIMAQRPTWAAWWPLSAAGWQHKRYQKD